MPREWSVDVVTIGDRLSALTPIAAGELLDYLKEVYKLEPAFGPPQADPRKEKLPEKPPEQTEWSVILTGYDISNKVGLVKTYRELSGVGLKDSMTAVAGTATGTPLVVKEGILKVEAEKLKALLETNGGTVELK